MMASLTKSWSCHPWSIHEVQVNRLQAMHSSLFYIFAIRTSIRVPLSNGHER